MPRIKFHVAALGSLCGLILLAGCQPDKHPDALVGKWSLSDIQLKGKQLTDAQRKMLVQAGNVSYTLDKSGTGQLLGPMGKKETIQWEGTVEKLTITMNTKPADHVIKLSPDGKQLEMTDPKFDGQLVFTKS